MEDFHKASDASPNTDCSHVLFSACGDSDSSERNKQGAQRAEPDAILFPADSFLTSYKDEPADAPKVSQTTIDEYIKAFENLHKNGAANKETLEAFKSVSKALPNLDEKQLNGALSEASKNGKVEMMLVAMHLKEVLEQNGFKNISAQLKRAEGSIVLKNADTETYLSLQYSKDGAEVKIEKKK